MAFRRAFNTVATKFFSENSKRLIIITTLKIELAQLANQATESLDSTLPFLQRNPDHIVTNVPAAYSGLGKSVGTIVNYAFIDAGVDYIAFLITKCFVEPKAILVVTSYSAQSQVWSKQLAFGRPGDEGREGLSVAFISVATSNRKHLIALNSCVFCIGRDK